MAPKGRTATRPVPARVPDAQHRDPHERSSSATRSSVHAMGNVSGKDRARGELADAIAVHAVRSWSPALGERMRRARRWHSPQRGRRPGSRRGRIVTPVAGMLIVNPRGTVWWVGAAENSPGVGWPCETRDAAIALAHAILAAAGGGEVLIEDRNGGLVRKDSVQRAPQPARGVRQTLVQMPDGERRALTADPEVAQRTGLIVVGGVRYRLAGIDLATEPPILILRHG